MSFDTQEDLLMPEHLTASEREALASSCVTLETPELASALLGVATLDGREIAVYDYVQVWQFYTALFDGDERHAMQWVELKVLPTLVAGGALPVVVMHQPRADYPKDARTVEVREKTYMLAHTRMSIDTKTEETR